MKALAVYNPRHFMTYHLHLVMQHAIHKSVCVVHVCVSSGDGATRRVVCGSCFSMIKQYFYLPSTPLVHHLFCFSPSFFSPSVIPDTALLRKREGEREKRGIRKRPRAAEGIAQRKTECEARRVRERKWSRSCLSKGRGLSERSFSDMTLLLFWLLFIWLFQLCWATGTDWNGCNPPSETGQKNRWKHFKGRLSDR